ASLFTPAGDICSANACMVLIACDVPLPLFSFHASDTSYIYLLSLHDALPISAAETASAGVVGDQHILDAAAVVAEVVGEDCGADADVDLRVRQHLVAEVADAQTGRHGPSCPRHDLHEPDSAGTALGLRVEQ